MIFEVENCNFTTNDGYSISSVPVLNKDLSYDEFFTTYMLPNIPCIIKDVTNTWEAHYKWLNEQGTPNLVYLRNQYGSCKVTIYNCNEKYFNSQKTESCTFTKFLDTWGSNNCKYLKDWHLKNTFKDDHFYEVPIYFASDWLNEFLTENNEDDYRFVYMGQKGTWTPFHADVFNSFSWSANLCGSKQWILFPPGEEDYLRDPLHNLPYDISNIYGSRRHFKLIQNQGEAIFVPSGWHHQVWNLEDTISVNHNWVNGCNIMNMWLAIERNLECVKKEIEDCQDMENFIQHCQVMLQASFGMDFFKFYEFIKFISLKRASQVKKQENEVLFHGHLLGIRHAVFDLKTARAVVKKFIEHPDVAELFNELETLQPKQLLETISEYQ